MKNQQTVDLIAMMAVQSEKESSAPAELIAAQCAIESGWLQSSPGNNCFGIKDYKGSPGRQLLVTTEWFTPPQLKTFLSGDPDNRVAYLDPKHILPDPNGRSCYIVKDWFAKFPTLKDCFNQRAKLFSYPRYKPFFDKWKKDKDLTALIRAISPIYATAPSYADVILSLINDKMLSAAIKTARSA